MQQNKVACGALMGALVGDAAGATLEFLGRKPTVGEVEEAVKMIGGGCWETAPGQITDDGELTICLARSLVAGEPYDPQIAAQKYLDWYASKPFDIGIATRNAFSVFVPKGTDLVAHVIAVASLNAKGKSNGALMRSVPLGIWGSGISIEALVSAARLDTRLSHPNLTCQFSTAAYVVAIRHLMLKPGDNKGAVESAFSVLQEEDAAEVRGWLEDAVAGKNPGYHPQAGFVRYGFTHAFRHLAAGSIYIDAIKETLRGGGDTDTNACIVGGMIGALKMDEGIPESMKKALMECDTRKGNPRPAWLTTYDVVNLCNKLVPPFHHEA